MGYSDPSNELSAFLDRLPAVQSVGIADPDLAEPAEAMQAVELVLGIGLDRTVVPALLAVAQRSGVAAVVLRAPVEDEHLRLADQLGVEVHQLPVAISWHALHQQLLDRLSPAIVHADDELADLAQTIATLTGGPVTVEDSTSARVLAYSRSSDEIDELRRLSILGRSGPPEYLALLREWGVYDRLARSEEVVEIAEHPASGIRRRLAVGVFAGNRQLATIWVQQGSSDLGPHAQQALLGAARLTAQLLVRSDRHRPAGGSGPGELAAILAGQPAGTGLGRAAGRPCAVAVIEPGPAGDDLAAGRRRLDELTTIVTVHAAAFRRNALVDQQAGRVYLLLPSLTSPDPAIAMLTDLIAAARRHLDPKARAVLGTLVGSIAQVRRSSRAAEAALTVPSSEPVLSFDSVRPKLVAAEIENYLGEKPELQDERIANLIASDPSSARTLLGLLDTGSDVARVASQTGVHPTTVRYRLRRALASVELDLADADVRLATQVQLRYGLRAADKGR